MLRLFSAFLIVGLRLQVAATDGPVDTMDLLVSAEFITSCYGWLFFFSFEIPSGDGKGELDIRILSLLFFFEYVYGCP